MINKLQKITAIIILCILAIVLAIGVSLFINQLNSTDIAYADDINTEENESVSKTCQIIFDSNGGNFSNGVTEYIIEINKNTNIPDDLLPTTPTREGYMFGGWRSYNDNSIVIDLDNIKSYTNEKDKLRLSAYWTAIPTVKSKSDTIVDGMKAFFGNATVITLAVTIAVSAIGKAAIKIWRLGVNYKSSFATVEQQREFEESIRAEMRQMKTELQDSILKVCIREISRETRPLQNIQELTNSIQTDREILKVKLDAIDTKYNELRKMSENIVQLEQTVQRMKYADGTSDIRRSGK